MQIPELDTSLSPYTGYTRTHWEAVADQLLLSLRQYATDDHARILPPGKLSRNGAASDGLEGFARSFLIAGSRIVGSEGKDPHDFASWYAQGIAAGVDPDNPNRWPRPDENPQAKVEACSLALMLDRTRPWIWDTLDEQTHTRVTDYFATVIGTDYPPINWVWFRLVVHAFLRSVDERYRTGDRAEAVMADIEHDLGIHEGLVREHGWFADGPERAYDHYNTWAFAVYPTLWSEMTDNDLVTDEMRENYRTRLTDFMSDAIGLVGGDGSPMIEGRSLVYRFAAAVPFWIAADAGIAVEGGQHPGMLRRAASGELKYFLEREVPDERGLLTLGWFKSFEGMSQDYSGPGSPYWAGKAFLGLLLPADHPVWTAVEEPLPSERHDRLSVIEAPGWLVSSTAADGIVRIVNHGSDHAEQGAQTTDSPLYARIGYSTVTSPPMTGRGEVDPRDSTVGAIHPDLGWSHRSGFDRLALRVEDSGGASVGVASSRQHSHWVDVDDSSPDHGSGRAGTVHEGPVLTVTSVVRGAIEVRIVRAETESSYPVGIAGWPLSGKGTLDQDTAAPGQGSRAVEDAHAALTLNRPGATPLTSAVVALEGEFAPEVNRDEDVSPLGQGELAAPALVAPRLAKDEAVAAAVVLSGAHEKTALRSLPHVSTDSAGATITWTDGVVTRVVR